MKKLNHTFFLLLRAVVLNEPIKEIKEIDWNILYKISQYHNVANIICYAIDKMKDKPQEDIYKLFALDRDKQLWRDSMQEYDGGCLFDKIENSKKICILLKGFPLKQLYFQSDMRVMGDIDIYTKNVKDINQVLLDCGYIPKYPEDTVEHDVHDAFYKKPVMYVELHKEVCQKNKFPKVADYFADVEKRAVKYSHYEYIMQMNEEDTYIYLIFHLMKHYISCGVGIRSIIDIWIYLEKVAFDREYTDKILKSLDLLEFERNILKLIDCWFNEKKSDAVCDRMTNYIFLSGFSGSEELTKYNEILSQSTSISKNKFRHVAGIIFLPYKNMCLLYPILFKAPFLLPILWVARGFKGLFSKGDKIIQEIRPDQNNNALEDIKKHLSEVGLKTIERTDENV